jgi:predicted GIY-YIG superfamily endonuclease
MTQNHLHEHPHCVYRFFAEDGTFLYVGCTSQPVERIHAHSTSQPWWTAVAYAHFEQFATKREALDTERFYIEEHQPRHNVSYAERWAKRRQWKRPTDPHLKPGITEEAA